MNIDLSPPTLWGRQPVVLVTAVRALVLVAVAFGVALEPAQIGAVMLAVEAVLAVVTHQSVFAPATVDKLMAVTPDRDKDIRVRVTGDIPDTPSVVGPDDAEQSRERDE